METELLAEARDLLEAVVADNGAASVFADYRGTDGYICGFCSASAPEVVQIAHIPACIIPRANTFLARTAPSQEE